MQVAADRPQAPTAIRIDLGAIFVSLELSRSTWLITSLSPGGGEKMSKHSVRGSDVAALLARFAQLQEKAQARTGQRFPIIVIQEAGLDGFWIDRVLQKEGDRKPRRRSGFDRDIPPAPTGEDRQDRRRVAGSCAARLQARRTARLRNGKGTYTRGGRSPPSLPRAQGADRRA